ncbi:MAG: hypothetical protein ACI350_05155 [Prevotella sp.]
MKHLLLWLALQFCCVLCNAQEYTIRSAGQGKTGNYLVDIVVSTKKQPKAEAGNLVIRYAVHGVLFRGLMAADGYGEQGPMVKDPDVEETKAQFFTAFWNEGRYKTYASVVGSSLSVMKNKQTKMYETSAKVMVNKEALQHYMEESGIITGFSNLW